MAKSDVLKLPDDLEGNLRALLATPPAPAGTAGSRKAPPKPKPTPKDKRRKHTMAMSRRRAELEEQAAEHSAELARVLKDGKPKRKGSPIPARKKKGKKR